MHGLRDSIVALCYAFHGYGYLSNGLRYFALDYGYLQNAFEELKKAYRYRLIPYED